jgi:hypothetical protein
VLQKDQPDAGGLQEGLLADREHEPAAEIVERLDRLRRPSLALRPGLQCLLDQEVRPGKHDRRGAARQQRNRVKPAQKLAGEQRGDQQDDQQQVFQPQGVALDRNLFTAMSKTGRTGPAMRLTQRKSGSI